MNICPYPSECNQGRNCLCNKSTRPVFLSEVARERAKRRARNTTIAHAATWIVFFIAAGAIYYAVSTP